MRYLAPPVFFGSHYEKHCPGPIDRMGGTVYKKKHGNWCSVSGRRKKSDPAMWLASLKLGKGTRWLQCNVLEIAKP